MDEDFDALLASPLLQAPDDFTQRVMQQVHYLPLPARPTPVPRLLQRLQWLAFIGGGALGIVQLAAFMFGIWAAGSAG